MSPDFYGKWLLSADIVGQSVTWGQTQPLAQGAHSLVDPADLQKKRATLMYALKSAQG